MFKKISLLALGIIVGILIVAAMKPDEFRVERSVVIKAPPERIFPLMNDLRAFYTYSRASDVDGIGYTAPADAWASQPSGSVFGVQLNRRW